MFHSSSAFILNLFDDFSTSIFILVKKTIKINQFRVLVESFPSYERFHPQLVWGFFPYDDEIICKNHANICINLLLDFRQTIKLRHNFESYVRGHWVSHLCEKLIYHLLHWQFFNSRCLSLTQAMKQKQKSEHSCAQCGKVKNLLFPKKKLVKSTLY